MALLPVSIHLVSQGPIILRRKARPNHFQPEGWKILYPTGLLQYSTQLRASSGVPVPRLTVIIGVQSILPGELDEFIRPKLVGLDTERCQLLQDRAAGAWSNPIHPVIAGGEISARVTHGRKIQFLQAAQDILAEALFISMFGLRIIYAFINGPTDMFQKTAENPGIHRRNLVIRMQVSLVSGSFFILFLSLIITLAIANSMVKQRY